MSTLQKRYGSGYLWSRRIKNASKLKLLLPMFYAYDINHPDLKPFKWFEYMLIVVKYICKDKKDTKFLKIKRNAG